MVLSVPAPPVRAAGSRLTAGVYGSDVTDDINFLAAVPLFQAYQSAAQSIANVTVTALGLDTTVVDTYTGHSNVTNNSRYTCNAAAPGYYVVIGMVGYAVNGTGNRLVEIHKNGGAAPPLSQGVGFAPTTANTSANQAVAIIQLAAGDYVETFTYQTSGGALNTNPMQTGMSVFWLHA